MSEISTEDFLDTASLDTVTSNSVAPWTAKIQVFGLDIPFKLDTRADVTVITEESYSCIGVKKLTPPDNPICGPSGNRLGVKGWFAGSLSYGDRSAEQRIFVVKGLHRNLVGLSTIMVLNLAVRVDATNIDNVREEYPSLF